MSKELPDIISIPSGPIVNVSVGGSWYNHPVMTKETKDHWLAAASLTGTIIGVGIFGVPYAVSVVGVLPALAFFVVLGGIQLLQHLYLAEVAMICPDKLRFPGLLGRYVGPRARAVGGVANICGLWVGMVAYVIVGGEFLSVLLKPFLGGETFQYQVVWGVLGAAAVYFSLKAISRLGLLTISALIFAFILIFLRAIPAVRAANFALVDIKDLFLPYGIFLFSLSGYPAILEMEDVLEGRHKNYRSAVVIGTLVGAALTIAFGLVVYGVTGAATTEDAVSGLKAVLGGNIATLAALLGFLAIVNCFLDIGVNLRHTFQYDYKMPRLAAWALTVGVPFAIFLSGSKSFTALVSFSGAVFGGVTAILLAILYIAVTKHHLSSDRPPLRVPLWIAYASIILLAAGAAITIAHDAAGLLRG